jgi:hypothetical protein
LADGLAVTKALDIPVLGRLIPRLASTFDGEALAAVRAIERVLKANGRDWHDLAAVVISPPAGPPAEPPPSDADWRALCRFCASQSARLSRRQLDFIVSLAQWRDAPTARQMAWLHAIAARLGYRV